MSRSVLSLIGILLLSLGTTAARAAPDPTHLDEARAALAQVLAGDSSALDRAGALFGRLAETDPRDPLATAYWAETLALRAWHAGEREARESAARAVTLAEHALSLATRGASSREEVLRAAAFTYLTVARREFVRAELGDAEAVPRAEALFARTVELSPEDSLPLAYQGVILALRGGAVADEREQAMLIQGSLSALDHALAMAGAETQPAREAARAETRLLAAGTFIALPDAFRRFDQGITLLQAELAAPDLGSLPPRLRAHVHYQASLAARRKGMSADEVSHLRAYVELAPRDDPFASVVRARLAEVAP